MDFTREPIIETIITPREGYKLVIRSSTNASQEEYFVDAVEIVAFGHALFFRSLERPKAFLVPVSDYEVLEVREARIVLKNVGIDRSIKIGGGRETNVKASREVEKVPDIEEEVEQEEVQPVAETTAEARSDVRVDKKRDRRRHYRKRRGREEREEKTKEETVESTTSSAEEEKINVPLPEESTTRTPEEAQVAPTSFSSLLQPPPKLISETIALYRQNELFKAAFYLTEEDQYKPHDKVQELLNENDDDEAPLQLQEPDFVSEEAAQEPLESTLSEEGKEVIEESEEIENLEMPEEESEEGSYLFEDRSKHSLPLYAEEEDTSMLTESSYLPKKPAEEVEPENNHEHPSAHHEEN